MRVPYLCRVSQIWFFEGPKIFKSFIIRPEFLPKICHDSWWVEFFIFIVWLFKKFKFSSMNEKHLLFSVQKVVVKNKNFGVYIIFRISMKYRICYTHRPSWPSSTLYFNFNKLSWGKLLKKRKQSINSIISKCSHIPVPFRKGTFLWDLWHHFFHFSNMPGPLTNGIKKFDFC